MYLRTTMTDNVTEIVHIVVVIIKQFYLFIYCFLFSLLKVSIRFHSFNLLLLLDVLVTEHVFVYKISNMYLVQLTPKSFFRFEIVVAEMTEVSAGWND